MYRTLHDNICNIGANIFVPNPWRHHHVQFEIADNKCACGGEAYDEERGRLSRERGRWIVYSPTTISIDLHALELVEQSMERKIEEFWRRMGKDGGGENKLR
jgi:hypothetical protein